MKFTKILVLYLVLLPIGLFCQENFNIDKIYIISDSSGLAKILKQQRNILLKLSKNPKLIQDDKSKIIYNSYDAIIIANNSDEILQVINMECENKLIYRKNYFVSLRFNDYENIRYYDIIEIDEAYGTVGFESSSPIGELNEIGYSSFDPFNSVLFKSRSEGESNNRKVSLKGNNLLSINKINILEISRDNQFDSKEFIFTYLFDPKFKKYLKKVVFKFALQDDLNVSRSVEIFKKDLKSYNIFNSKILGFEDNLDLILNHFSFEIEFENNIFEYVFLYPCSYIMNFPDYNCYLKENLTAYLFYKVNTNIWNFVDTDLDNIDDDFDNCLNYSNTFQIDFDKDGLGAGCDCNDNNVDPIASSDTDLDGVCDDEDKCPTVPGRLINQGCPSKNDNVGYVYENGNYLNYYTSYKDDGIYLTSNDKYVYEQYFHDLSKIITIIKNSQREDSISASVIGFSDILDSIDNLSKIDINTFKVNLFNIKLDENRNKIPSIYIARLDSIRQLIPLYKKKSHATKSDLNIIDDCLSLMPLYLDSIVYNSKDSMYNLLLSEMLDDIMNVVRTDTNSFRNIILNDKILLPNVILGSIFSDVIKGYLLPAACFENAERKRYSKNAKAFYYIGSYGKRHDIKHFFQYGTNPHYELFSAGNFYVSYLINDSLILPDLFHLKTVKDSSNYKIHFREQTLSASQDKVSWKAIIIFDFLDEKKMEKAKALPGLTDYDESNLINALDEVNRVQKKYFLIKGKLFYEQNK